MVTSRHRLVGLLLMYGGMMFIPGFLKAGQ
jgi:hypothetical protein